MLIRVWVPAVVVSDIICGGFPPAPPRITGWLGVTCACPCKMLETSPVGWAMATLTNASSTTNSRSLALIGFTSKYFEGAGEI